jgi:general secretion pathway protein M
LFAFLEKLAVQAGVNGNIDYMKPSSVLDKVSRIELSLVEMKLKGIKLSQLMSYLYLVETSENVVFVKRLAISMDGKNKRSISAVLHVETVKT